MDKLNYTKANNVTEFCLLGCVLIDMDNTWHLVRKSLKEDDFYLSTSKLVFNAFIKLHEKNKRINIESVVNYLWSNNFLEDIGSREFLDNCINAVASTAEIQTYIDIIKDFSNKRKLEKVSFDINSSLIQNKSFEEILVSTQETIYELKAQELNNDTKLTHMSNDIRDRVAYYKEIKEKGFKSDKSKKPTGFHELDIKLNGGFGDSQFILLAGRPAMGKTALAMQMAQNIVKHQLKQEKKKAVAIFSLEMNKDELIDRMISNELGVSSYTLKTGGFDRELEIRLDELVYKYSNASIYCFDSGNLTTDILENELQNILVQGEEIGAVFIDYVQLMEVSKVSISDNRQQEISKISRKLKQIARSLKCPVIALSQLSRDLEKRADKRPLLSDLRDSGSLEQDSDICMFVFRPEYYDKNSDKKKQAELIIAKHRNGEIGTINLYFEARHTKFSDLEGFNNGL